jgi:hypothetical protein
MTLVWEGESQVHCIVEHHHGRLYLFTDASREGVRVNSHYLMQSDVESPGPKSWKVRVTIYYSLRSEIVYILAPKFVLKYSTF